MLDKLFLQNKLVQMRCAYIPQSVEMGMCHNAKISMIEWAYNNGDIKSEAQVENKISILEEELLGAELSNVHDLDKKIIENKIIQLKELL